MLKIRKASERGHLKFKWLDAHYSFSFGNYFDPQYMGFKSLRVINEDFIDEGMGFDTHPHRNMEIITFMVSGSLAHKDSMGNISSIGPGEIQIMSAGTGITHSEFNPNQDQKTHSYQIWVQPDAMDVEPRYEQFSYKDSAIANTFVKLLSPLDGDTPVKIYQKMNLWYGKFEAGSSYHITSQDSGWLQVISGEFEIQGKSLSTGDGLAFEDENGLDLNFNKASEVLWFNFLH